ncbi:MAG: hypothetical protein FJ308_20920 [Planctomycetes bacterium]|nr:hypothetical protein [Planctomycetota bacterium]
MRATHLLMLPTHLCVGCRSVARHCNDILALGAEDLESFVQDRSEFWKDRATANATSFMVLDLRLWDAHSVHFPIDVLPTQRQRFRRRSKTTVATQAQDQPL